MILDSALYRSELHDLCFCNCVEGLGVNHEVTYAFTVVDELNPYVPK